MWLAVSWLTACYLHVQVIVTVPLAVLKANMVTFTPALNTKKKAAIQNLGAGLVEKVSQWRLLCQLLERL